MIQLSCWDAYIRSGRIFCLSMAFVAALWCSHTSIQAATPNARKAPSKSTTTRRTPPSSQPSSQPTTQRTQTTNKAQSGTTTRKTTKTTPTPPREALALGRTGSKRYDRRRATKTPEKLKLFRTSRRSFFFSQVVGMLVALGVIVLLIYVLLRWAANQMGIQTPTNQRLLRVVDRHSLEHKKGLWIVEAGGDYLLLATHEQGVTMLHKLDADKIEQHNRNQSPATDNAGFWGRLIRGKPQTPKQASPDHWASDASAQTTASEEQTPQETIPNEFEVVSDGQSASKETP